MKPLLAILFVFCVTSAFADQICKISGTVQQIAKPGLVVFVTQCPSWTDAKDTIPEVGQIIIISGLPNEKDLAVGESFNGKFKKGDMIETEDKAYRFRRWIYVGEWDGNPYQ